MRIEAYNQVNQIYQASVAKKVAKPATTTASDQLEISNAGREYQVASKAIAGAADVRADRVAELKKQVQNGTYSVTVEDLANKLVDDYFA